MTIVDSDENKFVAALAKNLSWIGAEWDDVISNYTWVDGSQIHFQEKWVNKKWINTSCVAICENTTSNAQCSGVGEWRQDKCVHCKPYICEREGKRLRVLLPAVLLFYSVIEALSWLERFAVRFIQGKITMVHWHKSTPRNVAYFLENGTLIFV